MLELPERASLRNGVVESSHANLGVHRKTGENELDGLGITANGAGFLVCDADTDGDGIFPEIQGALADGQMVSIYQHDVRRLYDALWRSCQSQAQSLAPRSASGD
jgi:hypothetical protein